MGQEIESAIFDEADYAPFVERLRAETDLLLHWEAEGRMSEGPASVGYELEACLIDGALAPAPQNDALLARLDDPLVVPELSRFNIEFNGDPQSPGPAGFSAMERQLTGLWHKARAVAGTMGLDLVMAGILPTLASGQLSVENMSAGNRYRALNVQVLRHRKGKPINLDIVGRERLRDVHRDVMLEAAATSFQVHLKVPASRAAHYYNAAKLASAALVAVGANSPFLFGHDLWAESRIPLFEQAVSVGGWDYAERVTFGVRFIESGLSEIFLANRQRYPVLLPQLLDTPVEKLAHLRLQNGTIWRWNRPLVGWDADGTPHYRIEHRVLPSGPTIADMIANAAFFCGLAQALATDPTPPGARCQFATARDNFYAGAREGLDARIRWEHRDEQPIARLILDTFLPLAEQGLAALGVCDTERDRHLSLIAARAASGRNGATWQRAHVARHGRDMTALLAAYRDRQQSEAPVHLWEG